jgi:hypothetical protein
MPVNPGPDISPQEESQRWSNRHISVPVTPAVPLSGEPVAPRQKHRSVPSERSSSFSALSHHASFGVDNQPGFGPDKAGVQTFVDGLPNAQRYSQSQLQPHVQMPHRGVGSTLPPGHTPDINRWPYIGQDDRMTHGHPAGPAGHTQWPSAVEPNISAFADLHDPAQLLVPPDQEHGSLEPSYITQPAQFGQPPHLADVIRNAPSNDTQEIGGDGGNPVPNNPSQRQGRDLKSSKKSIASTGGSSHSQTGGRTPQPHYLPRRLVMPAPLQSSQLNAPHNESAPYPSQAQHFPAHTSQPWQLYSRPPSPPSIQPPIRNPQSNGKFTRAQEIPMTQSRKLKKRSSVSGLPAPPAAVTTLSFEPTMSYVDLYSNDAPPARSKTEKAPKKVLSKRRTDL